MHLEQLVDVFNLGAGACGNALPALAINDLGVAALSLGHRADHRKLAVEHCLVEVNTLQLLLNLAHARQHFHHTAHAAQLFNLPQLVGQIVHVEGALAHPLGDLLGLFVVDILRGLFDERNHVAHAENAARDTVRVEIFQPIQLFAGAEQLDRLACDSPHRKCGTATAIAVNAREHNASDANLLIKCTCQINSVLTRERVSNQQGFLGLGNVTHGGGFRQQLFINMQPACGIQHHHVISALAGLAHGALGNLQRRFTLVDGKCIHLHLAAENLKLFLCCGAARIQRRHQHLALLAFEQALGDFCSGGGFAGALQPHHQNGHRRRGAEIQRRLLRPQCFHQRVMNDLDHHLARLDRLDDILPNRALPHFVSEGFHNLKRHVGFEKRAPHFAHGSINILSRKAATPGELVEYAR